MADRNFSFTIFFSLLAVGGGLALAVIGIFAAPEILAHLYQPRGYAVVIGGLAGVACLAFPIASFQQNGLLLWEILTGGLAPDHQGVLKESLMLATRSRETPGQEQKFYREIKPYISQQILQTGLDLLISGYERKMLQRSLQTRIQQHLEQHDATLHMLRALVHISWGMGLIAALSGVLRVYLLYNGAPGRYVAGVAGPFILGLVLAWMLFYPLLKQVERHRQAYEHYLKMSMEAILLLQERHHPHYLESVLRAYLPLVRSPIPPRPQAVVQQPQQSQQASGFQAALEREQHAPTQAPQAPPQRGPMTSHDGRPLSADQLRRFRPIGGDQNPS